MILYPIFATSIGLDHRHAGVFIGGTIHDVAQVVGAGYMISTETGDIATYVKLLRVAMLLPAVFAISFAVARSDGNGEGARATLPLVSGRLRRRSSWPTPRPPAARRRSTSPTTSRAGAWSRRSRALGMKTSFKALFAVGWRPVGLMVAETLWIVALVLFSVRMLI